MKSSVASDSSSILLVDDNKLGLRARKAVLEEMGHRITTASEGEEALSHFDRTHFDLVITDFKMPKMDGLELIRAIRARGGHQPIILISGYAEALGLTQENTGADDVIPKTVNEVPQLVRSVEKHLRRKPKKPAGGSHPPSGRNRRAG